MSKSNRIAKKTIVNKKIIFCILALCLLPIGIYYMHADTYASLTAQTEKQNQFRVGDLKATVVEEFDPPNKLEADKEYQKKVAVTNTGDQEIFLRVLAVPVITKTEDGEQLLLPATVDGDKPVLTIDYNQKEWMLGEDGYYYYLEKIPKGASTAALFTKVKMNQANIIGDYKDAVLSFEIKSEAIGVTKFAYRDAWWEGAVPSTNQLLEIDNILKKLAE